MLSAWTSLKFCCLVMNRTILTHTPIEDGTYYGITRGGLAAFSSLSGAYLQNYSSNGYEILLVDRSHQGEVQCT